MIVLVSVLKKNVNQPQVYIYPLPVSLKLALFLTKF